MALLENQIIRLLADTTSEEQIIDVRTSKSPWAWNGTDLAIHLGIAQGDNVSDLSEVESLTAELKEKDNLQGLAILSKTILAAELDLTVTNETWADGTKQHAVIEFAADDINLRFSGKEQTYWLVFSVITAAGKKITIGHTILKLKEDGTPSGSSIANGISISQADARYIRREYVSLLFFGDLVDEQLFGYFKANAACSIVGVQLTAQEAPAGAAVTMDLVYGADAEQTKIATLADGASVQETIFATPLAVAEGGVIRGKIKSIGSGSPGGYLTANLIIKP